MVIGMKDTAEMLGITYGYLQWAVWHKKVPEPKKQGWLPQGMDAGRNRKRPTNLCWFEAPKGGRMNLGFGKYQGWKLTSIPRGYLRWLLRTCELSDVMRAAVVCALQGRTYDPPSADDDIVDVVCKPWEDYGK